MSKMMRIRPAQVEKNAKNRTIVAKKDDIKLR
jgi:hypothetical protein